MVLKAAQRFSKTSVLENSQKTGVLIMKKFWKIFWISLGIAVVAALVLAVILGLVNHSAEITSTIVKQTMAIVLGICGIIGFVVVPLDLYLADKKQRG
jgi:ABC-type Fe3+ transport system permease subunit